MDPILRKKCLKVENIDETLAKLADNMIETMYAATGLGLAANQVGVSSDLFVIDVGVQKEKRGKMPSHQYTLGSICGVFCFSFGYHFEPKGGEAEGAFLNIGECWQ